MSIKAFASKLLFLLVWPALWLYLRPSHRARVLIVRGDQALLIRDHSKLYFDRVRWTVPGGGIKRNESPAQGAVRELREELGIDVPTEQLEAVGIAVSGDYGLRYVGHFFVFQSPANLKFLTESSEVLEARWLTLKDLQPEQLKREARQALQLAGLA